MFAPDRIQPAFLDRFGQRLTTIDSHTAGEPTRLLVGGLGRLPGESMQAKCEHFKARYDAVRKLLTRDPRGHRGIMGAVVTEPVTPTASFGLLYMDARRYPFLCGHATIGAVASLIEAGALVAAEGDSVITVDTPSGPLAAHTRVENGRVVSVAIEMVPAFVFATDQRLELPGAGTIPIDLVCVGGFFAMVSARAIGIEITPANSDRLISLGMAIIEAANRTFRVHHPQRPEVASVDVTQFYDRDPATGNGISAVIYGESHMDRSPCGTGTTARMTLLHHRKKLAPGQTYRSQGPLGTLFDGRIVKSLPLGEFMAIVCQIRGSAQITGYHQFVVDGADPFPQGYLL